MRKATAGRILEACWAGLAVAASVARKASAMITVSCPIGMLNWSPPPKAPLVRSHHVEISASPVPRKMPSRATKLDSATNARRTCFVSKPSDRSTPTSRRRSRTARTMTTPMPATLTMRPSDR